MDRSQGNKALNQVWEHLGEEGSRFLPQVGYLASAGLRSQWRLWAQATEDTKELLRQAGVQAPAVPTPTEEGEEAAGAWKAASTKLKELGEKKINMQKQVDNAKDTLRGILKEMQSLQEQINLAQNN